MLFCRILYFHGLYAQLTQSLECPTRVFNRIHYLTPCRCRPTISARLYTANTWLGTSIRPGLRYNPSLAQDDPPTTAAATASATSGKSTTTTNPQSSSSSPLSSSQAQSRDGDVVGKDKCTPTTADSSAGKTASTAAGVGDGEFYASIAKETIASGGTPAPSSPTVAGAGGNKRLPPAAIGVVMGGMRARRGILPAAQAAKAGDVAAAIVGLAQDWAGCRRGGEEVVDDRERVMSGDSQGARNAINCSSFVNTRFASRGRTTEMHDVVSSERSQERGKEEMEPSRRGISAHSQSESCKSRSSIRGPGRPVATTATAAEHSDPSLASTSIRADPQRQGQIAAGGRNPSISVDDTFVVQHSYATGTGASGTRIGIAAGEAAGEGQSTCFPTHLASDHSASSAAAAALSEVGITRDRSSRTPNGRAHGGVGGGLFIRTIGRAKRGPCMLTLSSSRHIDDVSDKIDIKHSTKKGNKLRRKGSMWESEANGGLLGPGEIKILVC